MHEYFCGPTSFALLRLPPLVKVILPPFPYIETSLDLRLLDLHGLESYWPNLPLHTLTTEKMPGTRAMCVREHVLTAELPPSSFCTDDDLGLTYASPQLTLLTLAPLISTYRLAMAMYELCGSFAIYNPGDELQKQIDILEQQRLVWPGGWRQVRTSNKEPTNLWHRDPLVTISELRTYGEQTKGIRGNTKYLKALGMVTGVCASPLEVQASMLLGLAPRLGGEGLGPFSNNHASRFRRRRARSRIEPHVMPIYISRRPAIAHPFSSSAKGDSSMTIPTKAALTPIEHSACKTWVWT